MTVLSTQQNSPVIYIYICSQVSPDQTKMVATSVYDPQANASRMFVSMASLIYCSHLPHLLCSGLAFIAHLLSCIWFPHQSCRHLPGLFPPMLWLCSESRAATNEYFQLINLLIIFLINWLVLWSTKWQKDSERQNDILKCLVLCTTLKISSLLS